MGRINGIDLARSLAIIGMIIVNFKMVFGSIGEGWLLAIVNSLSGKAAALFVVLAGVGISLMTQKGYEANDSSRCKSDRTKLLKRSIVLFVVGLSYMAIWPADILHFYGIYMLCTLLFIWASQRLILSAALIFIFSYPFLMWMMDYDQGWDFETLNYQEFWSFKGFFRNLFYNGFHPVFPWISFMLVGLWYGRNDLRDSRVVKGLLVKGLIGFVAMVLLSKGLLYISHTSDPIESEQLALVLGLSPMPPLPIYMLAGSFLSVAIISTCILVADRYREAPVVIYLVNCGQLALSIYVAHVVLGMSLVYIYDESMIGKYSIQFTFCYAMIFSFCCIVFSNVWLKYFRSGPLEWLFKKIY